MVASVFRQLLEHQKQGKLCIALRPVREAIDLSPPTAAEAQQIVEQAVRCALEAADWVTITGEHFCSQCPSSLQPGQSWHSEAIHVRALVDMPDVILVIQPGIRMIGT